MGAIDVVRELLIKVGFLGGPEARDEAHSTAESIKEIGQAGKEASSGTEASSAAQSNALKDVEGALTRASAQAANYTLAVKEYSAGSKIAAGELTFLQNSVGALGATIQKAQALGAIVPPATLKSLDDMRAGLLAATAATAPHVAAVGGVGKAHGDVRILTDAWQEALGRTGRTIAALSESTNPFIAAIGRFLLPLGAAAVGLLAFNKVAGELKERGVDIATVGDRWSSVMDTLAISLGGTSKAMGGMVADLQKTQSSFESVSPEAHAYANGLELVAAAQVGANDPMKLFVPLAADAVLKYGDINLAAVEYARTSVNAITAANDFNKSLNVIRTTAPDIAAAFTQEFFALAKLPEGSKEAAAGYADLVKRVDAARASSEEFTKSLVRLHPGVADVGKQFEKWTQEISSTDKALTAARAAGMNETQIMGLLGPSIHKVAAGYAEFGVELQGHDRKLAEEARLLAELAVGHTAFAAKIAETKVKLADEAIAYEKVTAAVTAGIAAGMSAGQADAAQADKARQLLEALEKKKLRLDETATAEIGLLSPEQRLNDVILARILAENSLTKAELDEMAGLRGIVAGAEAVIGVRTKELLSMTDRQKAGADLAKKLQDESASYEKARASIEAHRQAAVGTAQAEASAVVGSIDAQLAALNRNELGNEAYTAAVKGLMEQRNAAQRTAAEIEKTENDKANTSIAELAKTHTEKVTDINLALAKLGVPLEEANHWYEELKGKVAAAVKEWEAEEKQHIDTGKAVDGHVGKQKELTKQLGDMAKDIGKHVDDLGKVHTKHKDLGIIIPETKKHAELLGDAFRDIGARSIPVLEGGIDGLVKKCDVLIGKLGDVANAAHVTFGGGGGEAAPTAPSGGAVEV